MNHPTRHSLAAHEADGSEQASGLRVRRVSRPSVTTWGLHNNHPELDLIESGFISIGWDRLGDLRLIGPDREDMKAHLAAAYPNAKPRAIPAWAGILLRFAFEMRQGDLVIYPYKPDSTLNFGRIAGEYHFDGRAKLQRNRRAVVWLHTGVPRGLFSTSACYELSSALTLFRVRRHEQEFSAFARPGTTVA
jgi:restriction system protein